MIYHASLPVRGAWIEIIFRLVVIRIPLLSLPVRGAWIEIIRIYLPMARMRVAPRKGSVD